MALLQLPTERSIVTRVEEISFASEENQSVSRDQFRNRSDHILLYFLFFFFLLNFEILCIHLLLSLSWA